MSDPRSTPLTLGPYAAGPPLGVLIGQPLARLEASTLFRDGGVRMRRMVERDRLYVGTHTDYAVTVDGERNVVALMVSLTPPDRDREDDCYGFEARDRETGTAIPLSYGWAVLLQLAHEVLGLDAAAAVELLNNLYLPRYLPRAIGELRLSLVAGKRASTSEPALVLLVTPAVEDG
jgi:hypothetical protein